MKIKERAASTKAWLGKHPAITTTAVIAFFSGIVLAGIRSEFED